MRALALSLLLLSGCFGLGHGCWEDSRAGTWSEPGIYERLRGDPAWIDQPGEENMPEGSRFTGDWVWVFRHLDADQSIRLGERDGDAFLGGLLSSRTSDAKAAAAVEDFILDHTGAVVDGLDFLDARSHGDPYRSVGGSIEAAVDIEAFLAQDGAWESRRVGVWDYKVGHDLLEVRVATIRYDGDWRADVLVDAGDRVRGPAVEAAVATQEELKRSATQWWQDKGLGEPTFQEFGFESQEVCT